MIRCTRCGKDLRDVDWTDLGTDMVCDACLTPSERLYFLPPEPKPNNDEHEEYLKDPLDPRD